jgi:hypothetical protein
MSNGSNQPNANAIRAIVGALTNTCPDGTYGQPFPTGTHDDFLFDQNFKINTATEDNVQVTFSSDATTAIATYFGPGPTTDPNNGAANAVGWLSADDITNLNSFSSTINDSVSNAIALGIWSNTPGNSPNSANTIYNGVVKRPPPQKKQTGPSLGETSAQYY